MAKKIKPLYHKHNYYCPICDTQLKRNHKMHCGVEFDWTGVKRVTQRIRILDALRHKPLSNEEIAKNTYYTSNYVAKMLSGYSYISDDVLKYIVDELDVYMVKLKNLRNELKARL